MGELPSPAGANLQFVPTISCFCKAKHGLQVRASWRIKNIEKGRVTFSAKDYRHGGKTHPLTLTDNGFTRRFAMHILPKGFTRIRHYGILSSPVKNNVIPVLQKQLGLPKLPGKPPLVNRSCPKCKNGQLLTIFTFNGRAPPALILEHFSKKFTAPAI